MGGSVGQVTVGLGLEGLILERRHWQEQFVGGSAGQVTGGQTLVPHLSEQV